MIQSNKQVETKSRLSDKQVETKSRLSDMQNFIDALKVNPKADRRNYFMEQFNLVEEALETMLFFGMIKLDKDLSHLEDQLARMQQLGYEAFIKEELEHLQEQYPAGRPVQFELYLLDETDDFVKTKLGGVSAFTEWSGKICLVVLPEETVRQTLKSVVNHEYHHHWRISALGINEDNETLLDRMILEGLAEHFVRMRLGDHHVGPYKDALTEDQAKNWWEEEYKYHINETVPSKTDVFMFGNDEKGLPFWGGYSIGYYLVKWFLEINPDLSIEALTVLPSKEFI